MNWLIDAFGGIIIKIINKTIILFNISLNFITLTSLLIKQLKLL